MLRADCWIDSESGSVEDCEGDVDLADESIFELLFEFPVVLLLADLHGCCCCGDEEESDGEEDQIEEEREGIMMGWEFDLNACWVWDVEDVEEDEGYESLF